MNAINHGKRCIRVNFNTEIIRIAIDLLERCTTHNR